MTTQRWADFIKNAPTNTPDFVAGIKNNGTTVKSVPASGGSFVPITSTNGNSDISQVLNAANSIDLVTTKGDGTLGAELLLKNDAQFTGFAFNLSGFDNSSNGNKGSVYFDAVDGQTSLTYGLYDNSVTTNFDLRLNAIEVTSNGPSFHGIVYASDYSTHYTTRSLIDKGYADTTYAIGSNYLPLIGGTLTGQIIYNTSANFTSAFVSTTKNYVIGAGNTTDLANTATIQASIFFKNDGTLTQIRSTDGTNTGLVTVFGNNQGVYMAANDGGSNSTSFAITNSTAQIIGNAAAFVGLTYDNITATTVSTNSTDNSLMHRGYNDLRYAPIGTATASFTTNDGKTVTITNGSVTSVV